MSASHVPVHARPRRRRTLLAFGAALAALTSAAPASAATVGLKITDPVGDAVGGSALDITGATIAQNTSTGAIGATVTFAATPPSGAALAIGLGRASGNTCDTGPDGSGTLTFLVIFDARTPLAMWLLPGNASQHQINPVVSGSTLTLATGTSSLLKKFAWNCAVISLQQASDNPDVLLGDTATASGVGAGAGQIVVKTDKPDKDKDGVPDVVDACPKVAGSTANGCLSIAAKRALRLGAKRVVVDKMVKRKSATCKPTAKGTVYDLKGKKKKKIGSGKLEVGVHGSYCHISGVIKTKKHGKKVQVKISGSGFKSFTTTVKPAKKAKKAKKKAKRK